MSCFVAIAIAVLVVAPLQTFAQDVPADAKPAVLSRVIGLNVTLDLPAGTCRVPNIVLAIAKDLRLPAGAELLPGRCQQPRPDEVTERIPLLGRTVGVEFHLCPCEGRGPDRLREEPSNRVG